MTPDFDKVTTAIREVAAQEIVPRFQNLKPHEVDSKSTQNDLVTEADRAAERALTAILNDLTPDYAVLGEEMAFGNPDAMSILAGDKPVWVLDPVDGTYNFVHGRSRFGVIVSLIHRTETLAGWLYAPIDDLMLHGVKGEGVTMNGQPHSLHGSPPQNLTEVRIDSPSKAVRDASTEFATVKSSHSSLWAYLDVLMGDVEVSISNPIYPWDHAAGVFLVNEAGGEAKLWSGARYDPSHVLPPDDRKVNGPPRLIAAVNTHHWDAVVGKLASLGAAA